MTLKVMEVFSGIGTQRMALERLGIKHEVVAVSEVDEFAINSYYAIHKGTMTEEQEELIKRSTEEDKKEYIKTINAPLNNKGELKNLRGKKLDEFYKSSLLINNLGDISKVDLEQVPDHDLLTYSFPCTSVSISGLMEGLKEGSNTESSLLWDTNRIIEYKKPKYLIMENVKNLVGKRFLPDFKIWEKHLEGLGYTNYWDVLNSKDYGIPQNRERVYMVSVLGEHEPYKFPKPDTIPMSIRGILEEEVEGKYYLKEEVLERIVYESRFNEVVDSLGNKGEYKVGGIDQIARYDTPTRKNSSRFRTYNPMGLAPTVTTMQGGGRELHIPEWDSTKGYRIRKLTPKECWRLMGIDDTSFIKAQEVNSDTQLYKQAGNAIVVQVLEGIFRELLK